ncbi:WD40 repeat-like protein [Clavulina sp. PMI_390]|nr:WD40 repeat-like protein [Clavulina sp. PMI_390]
MAEIPLGNQPFDIAFHPSEPIVLAALLTGQITAFSFTHDQPETEFNYEEKFSVRPTKRSCRGLAMSTDGGVVYSVTKDKTMHAVDVRTGAVLENVIGAHDSAINRIALTMPNVLATGDDDGIVKLWDTRILPASASSSPKRALRTYTHHTDYISDFLFLSNKKHLVSTSADGTLSVIDIRAGSRPVNTNPSGSSSSASAKKKKKKKKGGNGQPEGGATATSAGAGANAGGGEENVEVPKGEPIAQSEDQEDELLSIVGIRGGTKTVVGTQSGILSVFNNERRGWGDSVDRIPGHPHSVDALCVLPSHLIPASASGSNNPFIMDSDDESASAHGQAILATGSSDGMVRLVQLFPTKVLGVVADHGEFPVERIKMDFPADDGDGNGPKSRWLASISHNDRIVMTDLKDALEDSDDEDEDDDSDNHDGEAKDVNMGESEDESDDDEESDADEAAATRRASMSEDEGSDSDMASDADEPATNEPPARPPNFSLPKPLPTQTTSVSASTPSADPAASKKSSALDSFSFSGTFQPPQRKALTLDDPVNDNALEEVYEDGDDGEDSKLTASVATKRRASESSSITKPSVRKLEPKAAPGGKALSGPMNGMDAAGGEDDEERKRKKRKKEKKPAAGTKGDGAMRGGVSFDGL